MRKKSSEMTPIQKMGRRNKRRGYSTEKQLERFLNDNGIPSKRVPFSGALKNIGENRLRGDVIIECGKKPIRVEVKSRQTLPSYITGVRHHKPWNVKEIEHLCYILTDEEFLILCKEGNLPQDRLKISSARCKQLETWFKQDDSDIVAMKEYNSRIWRFAVKIKTAIKIGGRYK